MHREIGLKNRSQGEPKQQTENIKSELFGILARKKFFAMTN